MHLFTKHSPNKPHYIHSLNIHPLNVTAFIQPLFFNPPTHQPFTVLYLLTHPSTQLILHPPTSHTLAIHPSTNHPPTNHPFTHQPTIYPSTNQPPTNQPTAHPQSTLSLSHHPLSTHPPSTLLLPFKISHKEAIFKLQISKAILRHQTLNGDWVV